MATRPPRHTHRTHAATINRRRYTTGRRLVVVDIENLIGGAVLHHTEALWARRRLTQVRAVTETDQVVIGTSHIGLIHVGTAWTHQRYVVGSGPDGADLALLEVLAEDLPTKYDEVVLASGDGIFTDAVAALCAAGVRVHVVAVRNRLSRRLRLVASQITLLDQPYDAAAISASA
ncbi:NYN domain-containing protein [Nocardioides halotolerans]|uniref:NYN domain-containing protein n=1 Tax=Nocardioides halotolerans TaxID=433660 RepID=UPI00041A52D3|nr:NYN domain-containing protein [Nocardioides halotolerans]